MKSLTIRTTAIAVAACLAAVSVAAGPKHAMTPKHGAVAKLGEKAPDFTLSDINGKEHKLSEYTEQGKVVVLEWFNPGCPFVKKHYRGSTMTMNKLAGKYREQNVVWLRVNSGAPGKQGHGLEFNRGIAEKWDIKDPILLDETGKVGRLYNARNTPSMAVISGEGILAYWGAIDNDRGARSAGETNYVDLALTQILAGESVKTAQTKPYGCGVKY